MAQVQQRILIAAALCGLLTPVASEARKFYHDDPLWRMPEPLDASKAVPRKLSEYYDFFYMTFGKPGEKNLPGKPIKAGAINTLGEVPDSLWYTNRHGRKRMSIEELVRGPGNTNAPAEGQLRVTSMKAEGVTPGFRVKDAKGRTYQIKFDTRENYELSTGADVMGAKFFYALGYYTPENYIVYFNPERLIVEPGTRMLDHRGREREMRQSDIEGVLAAIPREKDGRYRAVASLFLQGKPLEPFRYYGVRTDDPNDIVPHEHRRDLRGLKVFSAWLNHTDTKSLNSLDMLVDWDGKKVIKHHLIDFSAAFGTDAFEPKSPRAGNVYLFDWTSSAKEFFTFGLYVPKWARADYQHVKGAGRIESQVFDPEAWKSHYYNPAFENCLPDDGFWAAKQIVRFTEPEIRALVNTAQYTDKAGVDYLVRILTERQLKIAQEYFNAVLPLDEFRVDNGRLAFEDLGVKHGVSPARTYTVAWSTFDNVSERTAPIASATTMQLPSGADGYYAATIHAGDPKKTVTVFVRRRGDATEVVGVDRTF